MAWQGDEIIVCRETLATQAHTQYIGNKKPDDLVQLYYVVLYEYMMYVPRPGEV